MKLFLVCLLVLGSVTFVSAQADAVAASVSVIGEAEVSVAPDQVRFTFEIVTTDKEVSVAKRANDASTARTLAAAKAFQIAAGDIQTDSLTIVPKYAGDKDLRPKGTLVGYDVTKRILVTLKDLEKIDEFLSKAIDAGVNRVVNVSIENSRYQEHQEQVRAMAIKNARAKATAYAQQLGQTIGKAYVIREEGADQVSYGTGIGNGSGNGNGSGDGDDWADPNAKITPYSRPVTFALGNIKIEETIYVTFRLN